MRVIISSHPCPALVSCLDSSYSSGYKAVFPCGFDLQLRTVFEQHQERPFFFFPVRLSGRSDFKVDRVGSGDRWYGGKLSLSECPLCTSVSRV